MKSLIILCVLLLNFATLANAQESIYLGGNSSSTIHTFDVTEKEINDLSVKIQNPLRDVDENLRNYIGLLNLFTQLKKYNVAFANSLIKKIQNNDTLSGAELYQQRRNINIYYIINKKILDFAKAYDFGGFTMSKSLDNEAHNRPLLKAYLIWLSGHLVVLDHLQEMETLLYESGGTFRRIFKNALIDKVNAEGGINKTLNELLKVSKYSISIG